VTGPVARTPADSPKAANALLSREAMSLGEQSSTCRASTFGPASRAEEVRRHFGQSAVLSGKVP
jgi:hypothetical protein